MKHRKVNSDDMDLIYEWANDPVTRQNSYSTDEITYQEHKAWFGRKLSDDGCHFLLFTDNNDEIGFVRFDEDEDDKWIISINVAPEHRGKKYSTEMLEQGVQYIKGVNREPIKAYIKDSNKASIKTFEKAGFEFEKELDYKGYKSYLFICK